jgi:hypothetical protein
MEDGELRMTFGHACSCLPYNLFPVQRERTGRLTV